ncbi:adenylosuccinate lyase [Roseovarius sp. 2305UL8-3]|uniref:adenylosuccinate lyase n=1 Tax=Roseovarius conchicola TaxID=3121636 RepID=UPI003528710D
MTRKTLIAAVLIAASSVSTYAGCRAHTGPVMSCAEGMIYDAESRSCVAMTTG